MKSLSQIGEIRLLEQIARILKEPRDSSVICGIGDDAAVLRISSKKLLFTTDALLEGVHFDWRFTSPRLLGRKSLSVNLSDIAAMGGSPRWAVISLALPRRTEWKALEEFYRGLQSQARDFGVRVVGGDTDHSLDGWKITVALLGEADRPVYRSGAKAGDRIWVTGTLGNSALGLELLKRRGRSSLVRGQPRRAAPAVLKNNFIRAHLDPRPRVREGSALAEKRMATSLIDVSDGLLLDLKRLMEASRLGARIDADAVPWSPGFFEACLSRKADPLELSLSGGEDYELLFTAPARQSPMIQREFSRLGTRVTSLGEMTRGRGLEIFGGGKKVLKSGRKGYLHF